MDASSSRWFYSFIKDWKTSPFRDSFCGLFSGGGSPVRLRLISSASAYLDNLQGHPFQPGFRGRLAPALALGSGVSQSCCLMRNGGIGAEPSTEPRAAAEPARGTWRGCFALGRTGAVPPTIPQNVMCTRPASLRFPPVRSMAGSADPNRP